MLINFRYILQDPVCMDFCTVVVLPNTLYGENLHIQNSVIRESQLSKSLSVEFCKKIVHFYVMPSLT